jgi:hypothetical protein
MLALLSLTLVTSPVFAVKGGRRSLQNTQYSSAGDLCMQILHRQIDLELDAHFDTDDILLNVVANLVSKFQSLVDVVLLDVPNVLLSDVSQVRISRMTMHFFNYLCEFT